MQCSSNTENLMLYCTSLSKSSMQGDTRCSPCWSFAGPSCSALRKLLELHSRLLNTILWCISHQMLCANDVRETLAKGHTRIPFSHNQQQDPDHPCSIVHLCTLQAPVPQHQQNRRRTVQRAACLCDCRRPACACHSTVLSASWAIPRLDWCNMPLRPVTLRTLCKFYCLKPVCC